MVGADTGPGNPKEHLRQLFEPFLTTRTGSGTGLRPALSKKIIKRWWDHSGRGNAVRGPVRFSSDCQGVLAEVNSTACEKENARLNMIELGRTVTILYGEAPRCVQPPPTPQ
jgi:hypothetical protein